MASLIASRKSPTNVAKLVKRSASNDLAAKSSFEQGTLDTTVDSMFMMDDEISPNKASTDRGVLHNVNVNILGIAGITVDRYNCRDITENNTSPAPPKDMKAIITIRELDGAGQVLQSEWSSALKQSAGDANTVDGGENLRRSQSGDSMMPSARYLALWNSGSVLPGSPLSLDTRVNLDPSSGHAQNKSFELILSLVDSSATEKEFAVVPIGSSILTLEGSSGCSVVDLPVDNVIPSDSHPVSFLNNANYVAKKKKPETERPSPEQIKSKRGKLGKLFKRRQLRKQQLRDKRDGEGGKKGGVDPEEEEEEEQDPVQPTDLSATYTVDSTGDAVLRIELDWKVRDNEIERNIEQALSRGQGLIQARRSNAKYSQTPTKADTSVPTTSTKDVGATERTKEVVQPGSTTDTKEPIPDSSQSYFESMWENTWGFDWNPSTTSNKKSVADLVKPKEEEIAFYHMDPNSEEKKDEDFSTPFKPAEKELHEPMEEAVERILSWDTVQRRMEQSQTQDSMEEARDYQFSTSPVPTTASSTNSMVSGRSQKAKEPKRSPQEPPSNPSSPARSTSSQLIVESSVERILSWDATVQSEKSFSPDPAPAKVSDAPPPPPPPPPKPLASPLPDPPAYESLEQDLSWDDKSSKSAKSIQTSKSARSQKSMRSRNQNQEGVEQVLSWDDQSAKSHKTSKSSVAGARSIRSPPSILEEEPSNFDDEASAVSRDSKSVKSSGSSPDRSRKSPAYMRRLIRSRSASSDNGQDSKPLETIESSGQTALKLTADRIGAEAMRAPSPSAHSMQSTSLHGENFLSEAGFGNSSDAPPLPPSIEHTQSQLELVFSQSETTLGRSEIGGEAAIRAMTHAAKNAIKASSTESEVSSDGSKGNSSHSTTKKKMLMIPSNSTKRDNLKANTELEKRRSGRSTSSTLQGGASVSNDSLRRGGSTVKLSNRKDIRSPDSPERSELTNERLTDDEDAFSFSVATRREYSVRGRKMSASLLPGCGIITDVVDTTVGRCHDDDDISWQNTMDDESLVTRSTYQTVPRPKQSFRNIRNPSDLIRACDPNNMADLGEAVLEEGKDLRALWKDYKDRKEQRRSRSQGDENSIMTGTDYTATDINNESVEMLSQDLRDNGSIHRKASSDSRKQGSLGSTSKRSIKSNLKKSSVLLSPDSVVASLAAPPKKSVTFSESLMNMLTCTTAAYDPDGSNLVQRPVPTELFSQDEGSVGALTMTTHEQKLESVGEEKPIKSEIGIEAEDIEHP